MSNLHRIQWIDARIREKKYPNAKSIADKFEISQRQAARDIEYLRYSLSAPLEYSAKKNGFYYADEAFVLPGVLISEDEKEALSFLASQYKSMGGATASQLADLFSRLTGEQANKAKLSRTQGPVPFKSVDPKEVKVFRVLEKAMAKQGKVKMNYLGLSNAVTQRTIHIYKLFFKSDSCYAAAFCELRNEIRVFKLSRMKDIKILNDTYEIPENFEADAYGKDFHWDFRKPYEAKIQFDNKDGIESVPFTDSSKILTDLLARGRNFSIISPNWLKKRLQKKLSDLLKKNVR